MGTDVRTYAGLIPNIGWGQLIDAQCAILLLKVMQFFIWMGWLTAWASATTMEDLSQRVMCTRGGRALLRIVVQALFGVEPTAVSVLSFCRYINASDSIERMSEIGPGSLQCWTMRGGAQQLSIGLAHEAASKGIELHFDHVVTSITKGSPAPASTGAAALTAAAAPSSSYPIRITCANGRVFEADHVVIAAPAPIVNQRITFSPPLSPARAALMSDSTMGCIIKSIVVYDRAWWRAAGYSGEVICDTASDPSGGPAFNIFDGCTPLGPAPPTGQGDSPTTSFGFPVPPSDLYMGQTSTSGGAAGVVNAQIEYVVERNPETGKEEQLLPVLVVFINGAKAAEWSNVDAATRRNAVLRQLARWFGNDDRALAPLEYIEQNWVAYPHTRGCPIATYGRGVLESFGLHKPLGAPDWPEHAGNGVMVPHRLHFCGTETSPIGTGFMDGAIRSGQRVADEVVADLATAPLARQWVHAASTAEAGSAGSDVAIVPALSSTAALLPSTQEGVPVTVRSPLIMLDD